MHGLIGKVPIQYIHKDTGFQVFKVFMFIYTPSTRGGENSPSGEQKVYNIIEEKLVLAHLA